MQVEPAPADPLLFDYPLPLRAVYSHVGFPVEIITNSPQLLEAAEESFGKFEHVFALPPVQLHIGVLPGSGGDCPPLPLCRGQRNMVVQIADQENYAISDLRQGFAFGWLTEAAVQNRAYLRWHFLEGTSWILLEALYLTSVHGACVQLDGTGVLLCGDSGAGKSSLAYACARNGWNFLCDDASCLVRKRAGRTVTGNPYQLRFRETAVELFPELRKQPPTPRATGEMAIELPTGTSQGISTISECSIDYIVFLNRNEPGVHGLFRVPKQKALRWLERTVCFGEQQLRDEHKAALHNLLSAEVLEVRYTTLDTALRLLETLVRRRPSLANQLSYTVEGSDVD